MSDSASTDTGGRMSAEELITIAKETIVDLTQYVPESVSGLQWDGEHWQITVDVCELERIPSTTDVMASYVVQLDEGGGLVGYKRSRRYLRSQVEED